MQAPSTPDDHANHDHGEGGHEGELFPRVLTAQLVGEREAERVGRETRQVWLLAAGLGILALGLPTARSLGQASLASPLSQTAISWIARATETPQERVGYALAALCFALSIPLIASTLRAVGFAHLALLPATLIAVLSPLGWIGASGASPFCLGVLVSAWLLRELFTQRSTPRLLTSYAAGVLLHADAILLLPAIMLGAALRPTETDVQTPARPVQALLVALCGIAILVAAKLAGLLPETAPWPFGTAPAPLGRPDPALNLLVPAGLGIGLWGLIAPWTRRADEVSRPPIWCLVFIILPLPTLFFGGLSMGSWLVPAAALGLADLVQRGRSEQGNLVRGFALLGVQLLLTLILVWHWESRDPDRAWRAAVSEQLESTDLIVTDDPRHQYLLSQRWGLETRSSRAPDLASRAAGARASGARIVLDSSQPAELPPALAGTTVVRLGVAPTDD